MGVTHWIDKVILAFFVASAGCLAIIQVRKQSKYGYWKGPFQELDSLDMKILKLAGILFIIFLASLAFRLLL